MENKMRPQSYSDDEISLIDLWGVLIRRKTILGSVFAVCLAGAVAAALIKNDKYLYSTSLEIGAVIENGERVLIDSPDTVLSKIKEGYIPAVLSEYAKSASDAADIEITVRLPKNSEIVVIESTGKESVGDTLKALEGKVIDLVKLDHSRIIEVTKNNILSQLQKLKRRHDELQDQEKLILSDVERIKVTSGLVEQQFAEIKSSVEASTANRKNALNTIGNETSAMTLLMIDSETDQNKKRMAELEERLHVVLPNKKDNLEKALADNRRARENNQTEVDKLLIVLKNIRDTRAIIEPTQSLKPVGIGKPLIVLLGAMLGLMLGIFAAFFAEFLAKAREQLKEQAD
jgi:uncharacterized protein involved in exopolysaccharide biosynthesis